MSSTSNTTSIAYLVKFLRKKIALELVGDIDKIHLLTNLTRDFRADLRRSVNYACFFIQLF